MALAFHWQAEADSDVQIAVQRTSPVLLVSIRAVMVAAVAAPAAAGPQLGPPRRPHAGAPPRGGGAAPGRLGDSDHRQRVITMLLLPPPVGRSAGQCLDGPASSPPGCHGDPVQVT
jgi:hypothetical protein